MKTQSESKADKKTTNEKPVSLYPLDFREALAVLLKVKSPAKKKNGTNKSSK